jgi:hypothetical protein
MERCILYSPRRIFYHTCLTPWLCYAWDIIETVQWEVRSREESVYNHSPFSLFWLLIQFKHSRKHYTSPPFPEIHISTSTFKVQYPANLHRSLNEHVFPTTNPNRYIYFPRSLLFISPFSSPLPKETRN